MLNEQEKEQLASMADELMNHCQGKLGFSEPPALFFVNDEENAKNVLGKTAHYDPQNKRVGVYTSGRHTKDILRSLAHELVHHMQNLRGDFDEDLDTTPGYAQKDPKLRKMEAEAYLLGNMLFRDWEDGKKKGTKTLILKLNERKTIMKDKIRELVKKHLIEMLSQKEEQNEAITMPSSGGSTERPGRRKKRPGTAGNPGKQKGLAPDTGEEKEEELEEQSKTDRPDRTAGRDTGGRRLDEEDEESVEESEEIKEGCSDDEESAPELVVALDEEEQLEEDEETNESKVMTAEKLSALYESRFGKRDNNLYERLVKTWINPN